MGGAQCVDAYEPIRRENSFFRLFVCDAGTQLRLALVIRAILMLLHRDDAEDVSF